MKRPLSSCKTLFIRACGIHLSSSAIIVSNYNIPRSFRESFANAVLGTRGEQTAQALEANLTSLERKLDDFLASFDEAERQKVDGLKVAKGRDVSGKS